MWIDKDGNLYEGESRVGDREATEEEVEAWEESREPDPAVVKKDAVLDASLEALKSGALNRVLWGIIESTILELMKNPIVIAASMTRNQIIAALVTPASPYYNEDFKKTYDQYNTLKALIDGDPV